MIVAEEEVRSIAYLSKARVTSVKKKGGEAPLPFPYSSDKSEEDQDVHNEGTNAHQDEGSGALKYKRNTKRRRRPSTIHPTLRRERGRDGGSNEAFRKRRSKATTRPT